MEWDKKIPLGRQGRQDLQDYWPRLNTLRSFLRKFNGVKIFFACGGEGTSRFRLGYSLNSLLVEW